MAANRTSEDVERDLREIFGDNLSDDLPAQFHEVEISQIQRLLERGDDISSDTSGEDINSDEDFDDAGDETMDVDEEDSSSDEEAEMLAERERGTARRDPVTNDSAEWTLHQPRNVANKPSFTGTEELRVSEGCTTPYDFFRQLFTVEFLEGIVTATNLFATNLISNNCFANGRIHAWKPLMVAELLVFLGTLFHMGNIKLIRYSDYWRRHRLYNLFAKDYMSCNRFLLIFRCLKFGEDNLDSLFRYFNQKMTELYSPGEYLSIDESMILSRGRSGIRKYMQGKRNKYGIKLYVLATPAGTALQVHMYTGKRDAEVGGQGHTDKVVSKLLKEHLNSGRHIFMDNFYNSVGLVKFLLQNNTNCPGTLRSQRKNNPKDVCTHKLQKGGSIYRYNREGICVCKWHDKRDVLTLSTKLSPELEPFANRRGQITLKLEIVIEYNKYMSGVDRQHQMLAYYTCEHKTMRWYKKVGVHIFQMLFLNAYCLCTIKNGKTSYYNFREAVITSLLPPPPLSILGESNNNQGVHYPSHLPKPEGGRTKRKRCKQCWDTSKVRKQTLYQCVKCPSSPGFCLECFPTFHKYN